MIWPVLAMAALGAAKTVDENQKAAAERKRQAETTRYSPWTGMQGHTVQDASLFGNVAQGAAAGATLGQGMDKFAQDKELSSAYVDFLKNAKPQSQGLANASPSPMMMGSPGYLGSRQSPWFLNYMDEGK